MAGITHDITMCTENIRIFKEKLEQAETRLRFLQSIKDSERVFVLFIPNTTEKLYFDSIQSLKFWLDKYDIIIQSDFSEIENWMITAKVSDYLGNIYRD